MEYWSLQQKKLGAAGRAAARGTGGLRDRGGRRHRRRHRRAVCSRREPWSRSRTSTRIACTEVHEHLAETSEASRIESIVCDVTSLRSVERAFEEVSCRAGGIDILVPNAGIAHVATIEALEPEKFGQVVAVNLMGTFNTIKAAIPVLRRQATGGTSC